jgi:trans-L-3-hydroxyproline dehydratase
MPEQRQAQVLETVFDIETCEMHTGGEPVRIVTAGYPRLTGRTLLDKRREARERHDAVRRLLMHEPRGHPDMYGALLVEPDHPEADLAVLFLQNEGYSTMCGHAVIALGRYAIDAGLVRAEEPETRVKIQCPCGLVEARVAVAGGRPRAVAFRSVPAFALHLSRLVETRDWGPVEVDVGFGGAFYALLSAEAIGLDVRQTPASELARAGEAITNAVAVQLPIAHPHEADLGFLYGTILTDGRDAWSAEPSANACIFAGRQVDRSPTGSGVTARLAVQHRRRLITLGQERIFESVTGSRFTGHVVEEARAGAHAAVIVEVSGQAHYSGSARFRLEPDDPFPEGFLLG